MQLGQLPPGPVASAAIDRTRRRLVASAVAAMPLFLSGIGLPRPARAALAAELAPRELQLLHLRTGERLSLVYRENGVYLPDALDAVDRLFRDFRTGDVHGIDPALLDLLHDIAHATESTGPFEVLSGYRSQATNDMLRARGTPGHPSGVAEHSLHLDGRAVDVRLNGVSLPTLRRAALARRGGGVGYYPESGFVHIDTGRVRTW